MDTVLYPRTLTHIKPLYTHERYDDIVSFLQGFNFIDIKS